MFIEWCGFWDEKKIIDIWVQTNEIFRLRHGVICIYIWAHVVIGINPNEICHQRQRHHHVSFKHKLI